MIKQRGIKVMKVRTDAPGVDPNSLERRLQPTIRPGSSS